MCRLRLEEGDVAVREVGGDVVEVVHDRRPSADARCSAGRARRRAARPARAGYVSASASSISALVAGYSDGDEEDVAARGQAGAGADRGARLDVQVDGRCRRALVACVNRRARCAARALRNWASARARRRSRAPRVAARDASGASTTSRSTPRARAAAARSGAGPSPRAPAGAPSWRAAQARRPQAPTAATRPVHELSSVRRAAS